MVELDLAEAPGRRLDRLQDVVEAGDEEADLVIVPGSVTSGLRGERSNLPGLASDLQSLLEAGLAFIQLVPVGLDGQVLLLLLGLVPPVII